jgi:hypothetical protein
MDYNYAGTWLTPNAFEQAMERPAAEGDLVMYEHLDGTSVEKVAKEKDGALWSYNNYIIPRDQIVAIKFTVEGYQKRMVELE